MVGGSGMLLPVTRALAREGPVTLLSRGAARCAGPGLHPAPADWRDPAAFAAALDAAVAARGPFDRAVAWIHADAPGAPLAAARRVRGPFLHVLGSSAADPSAPDPGRRAAFEAIPGISYHEVILGFRVEGGRSRWLTDREIADGVLAALASLAPRSVVGVVEPWSARP